MKKLICVLLTFYIFVSLVGCGNSSRPTHNRPASPDFLQDPEQYTKCFEFEWNEEAGGYYVYERDGNPYVDVAIPSKHNGKPVVGIGKYAFSSYSKIRTVIVPESVTIVENYAFSYCDYLKYVEFQSGSKLLTIKDYAFNNCKIIEKVYVPASVEKIGYRAFSTCPLLEEVEIDSANKFYCNLNGNLYSKDLKTLVLVMPTTIEKEFTVFEGVARLEDGAFRDCDNVEIINLPSTIEYLGANLIGHYIEEIHYDGTIEEWEKIEKAEKWDEKAPNCVVVCTNGTVEK